MMKKTLLLVGFCVILLFYIIPVQGFESSPIGWASLTDGNVPFTITGGSAGATVTVTDANSLKAYATSTSPYVILVSGTITMPRGTSQSNTPQTILVQSNKTIVGIGSNPGVNGGFMISGKSNVIIRNLNIWYRDSVNQGYDNPWTDGITIQSSSQHIWVDHCNIFDSPDGLCDPTKQSNYLTLSWNKFYYTPDGNNTLHRNCCLVGSDDGDTGDRGKLKETFHHNWWGTNCKERMPRVRFGQVHVFNNYYSNLQSGGYCHGVGEECQIRVENNYYDSVPNPWKDYHTSVSGHIGWNTGNVFAGTSVVPTWAPNDYATIFPIPYSYTLDAGASVITNVTAGAGVNKLTPSPNSMTFSAAPYGSSSSSISMTATTATCADGVQYMFTCTAGGGHSSGWQSGASYTDTGLSLNTTYTYTVQARNATQTLFTSDASSSASATTQSGGSLPDAASSPTPANALTDVSITQDLSWTAGSGATSHDVYFGTTASPPFIGNQTAATYDTGTMAVNTTYYWRINEKNAGGTTTGTVWSFTTAPPPPNQATSPTPTNGAINVSVTQDLSWTAGSGATSHDVYFGTVLPGTPVNVTSPTYDTGTMDNNKTYYWRIDEKNAGGTTTGTVWHFTTIPAAPGQASSPVPSNNTTDVSLTQDLSWTAGSGATSHDVYFGTVLPGTPVNVTSPTYDTGTMASLTTYHWRIDEKNAGGTTTGTVWSFTTLDAVPPTPNPMTWATDPCVTTSSLSIGMVAATATDTSGVEYYFA
ncbi:MAG: hypothetical protein ABR969_08520, partial [Sedimentisphaerales bacterium]